MTLSPQAEISERYVPDDVSGVCLPGPASDTLDELRPMLGVKLARSAQGLVTNFSREGVRGSNTRWLEWLSTALQTMSPFQLAGAFDPPLASKDLSLDPEQDDTRSNETRAVACVRYLIGLPNTMPGPLPLAAGTEETGSDFFLPHLRVVVRTDLGPLAVAETDDTSEIVWTDGFALTIPKTSCVDDWSCEDRARHFWPIPEVHGFQILNCASEIAAVVAHMHLCEEQKLPGSMNDLARGLSFLREVWPAAYFAIVRQIKGLVLLQERDYTRSHSPLGLLGVIAMTAGDERTAGDLLVHEASHVRLNLMRQFDPLWEDREPGRLHESPWREDARPLLGLILGVHAFLNVTQYYKRVAEWFGEDEHAEMLFERQKAKVRTAWEQAKGFVRPTVLGERFFAELEREVLSL